MNRGTTRPILYKDLKKRRICTKSVPQSSFYHDSETLPAESRLGDQLATSFTGPLPRQRVLFHEVKTALNGR
jgi:hypothetical protein